MNRSYSKIRHIQEVNQILEKRLISEQTSVKNVYSKEVDGVTFLIVKYPAGFFIKVLVPNNPTPKNVDDVFEYSLTMGTGSEGSVTSGFKNKDYAQNIIEDIIKNPKYKDSIKNLYPKPKLSAESDSQLVANKNPYVDEAYKNARVSYSPSLPDGVLYTKWVPNVKEEFIKLLENGLQGKTIRYSTRDENGNGIEVPLAFGSNIKIVSVVVNQRFETMTSLPVLSEIKFTATYKSTTSSVNKLQFYLELDSENFVDYYREPPFDEFKINQQKSFKENPDAWYSKLSNFLKTNLINIDKIPNEFFEIRKVTKQKTDF